MDLSKAYDCLPHDLLVAKFATTHHTVTSEKKNSSYSDWNDIVRGVPQESILGPLLFSLFIDDRSLFIERTNICNFADDNTIYSCQNDLKTILEDLKYDMVTLLRFFKETSIKANPKRTSIYDSR